MTFPKLPKFPSNPVIQARWTSSEAQEFDSFLQKRLQILPGLLMENAGYHLAQLILDLLPRSTGHILFLIGPGNNGGDALVTARHLAQRAGISNTLWAPLGPPSNLNSPAANSVAVIQSLQIPIHLQLPNHAPPPDLIVDGLFGIGLSRPVTGLAAEAIQWASTSTSPVLAIDCPSGLDATNGEIMGLTLPAQHTLSFVGPKTGFYLEHGPATCGEIRLAPIGVSDELALEWLSNHRSAKRTASSPSR